MATFYTVGGKNYTLASSISSTATSITLTSFTLPITDQAITMATANTSIMYGTLQPGTTNSEFISFTGITQNSDGTATLTGVTRGLDREYPYTTDSTFKLPHPGQSIFILSDAPQVFNKYATLDNAQTFADINTFTVSPIVPTPTTSTQAANKSYVDGVAIAGAPNADTTTKGIVEIATQAEYDARTATGGTGASLVATPALNRAVLTHDYVASSGGSDAYAITLTPAVTAYTTGDVYYFKADVANTGTCTLNVNGLGAKTIKKLGGGTDLATGDILANQLVLVQYDGTNMQMLSSVATPIAEIQPYGNGADGAGTMDGSTVVAGMTPSGNVYTATRDYYFTDLTISDGVTFNPAGYRIFGNGTLTGTGTATISRGGAAGGNGGNGATTAGGACGGGGGSGGSGATGGVVMVAFKKIVSPAANFIKAVGGDGGTGGAGGNGSLGAGASAAGSGGSAGAASAALAAGSIAGGTGGAAGATGGKGQGTDGAPTVGSNGGAGTSVTNGAGSSGLVGATGGTGGGSNGGAGGAGGAAGTVTNPLMMPRNFITGIQMHTMSDSTLGYIKGSATSGSGGGGGGGYTTNYATNTGGGGGGAGGSGGTGGVVVVIYTSLTGTALTTAAVAGGAGGAGGAAGTSAGSASAPTAGATGTTGADGQLYLITV